MIPHSNLISLLKLYSYRLLLFPLIVSSLVLIHHPSALAQNGNSEDHDRDLQVLKAVKPYFPSVVSKTGVTNGFAIIVFIVDDKGRKRDFVEFAASHHAFARSTIRAVKKWEFSPRIELGKAQSNRVFVKASYDLSDGRGGIVHASIIDEAMFKNDTINNKLYLVSNVDELDYVPEVSFTVAPLFPKEMFDLQASGQVLVEFFIDPQGNVKAPGIKSSSNDYFAIAALAAIKDWKFQPPIKKGKPVTARAYQPFFFEYKGF